MAHMAMRKIQYVLLGTLASLDGVATGDGSLQKYLKNLPLGPGEQLLRALRNPEFGMPRQPEL
jgi:hypothetical protein